MGISLPLSGHRFDMDKPQDVAALIQIDRMLTRALEFERTMRQVAQSIHDTGPAIAALVKLANATAEPLRSWENEGGAL